MKLADSVVLLYCNCPVVDSCVSGVCGLTHVVDSCCDEGPVMSQAVMKRFSHWRQTIRSLSRRALLYWLSTPSRFTCQCPAVTPVCNHVLSIIFICVWYSHQTPGTMTAVLLLFNVWVVSEEGGKMNCRVEWHHILLLARGLFWITWSRKTRSNWITQV